MEVLAIFETGAPAALALNQWQHFAATMDAAGNVTLYKNGVAVSVTGTITIPNNDVVPTAILATADNGSGSLPSTVDVWFAAPVVNPSATSLANYTLVNAPGIALTNATLMPGRNLRVVLGASGPVPAEARPNRYGWPCR